jgi:uncharacterized membrane protein/protein-disulfide isomerase
MRDEGRAGTWSKVAPWVFLALAFVAAAATAILIVDYTRTTAVFCDEVVTGCGAVKASAAATTFGMPTPIFGLMGLLIVGILSVSNLRTARIAFAAAGVIGSAFAVYYIYSQVKLGQYCKYCLAVDGASILMGALALDKLRAPWSERHWAPLARPVLISVTAAVIGFFGARYVPPAPAPVQAEIDKTPNGQVCIVDFVDFECPFCREAHKQIHDLMSREPGKVRLVRKHVPLRMHPNAMPAAKACVCAAKLGKEDAYADKLMVLDPETFTPDNLTKLAGDLALDTSAFQACMGNPETEARINQDREDYKTCKGHGLPMLFVGRKVLIGLAEPAEFDSAYRQAQQ